jgi:D-xylose transport system permease protein
VSSVETPTPQVAQDREDERLLGAEGVRGAAKTIVDRVRAGELGALPVILGLVVIAVVFQALNSLFLSSDNLTNLLMECVPTGVIALGVVCVLLVAQIDLSVGSVSGLTAGLTAVLFVNKGLPAAAAVGLSILTGVAIGLLYGLIFNRLGVPSFVITLAGLLAFLGIQLWLLGSQGAINLPFDSGLVKFAQLDFVPESLSYVLVLLGAAGLFATGWLRARERRRASLSGTSLRVLVLRSVALLAVGCAAVFYLNTGEGRGIGWMFVFFLGLVLVMNYVFTRTSFGRSLFAVGGNPEAARRAGIRVGAVYTAAFVL